MKKSICIQCINLADQFHDCGKWNIQDDEWWKKGKLRCPLIEGDMKYSKYLRFVISNEDGTNLSKMMTSPECCPYALEHLTQSNSKNPSASNVLMKDTQTQTNGIQHTIKMKKFGKQNTKLNAEK